MDPFSNNPLDPFGGAGDDVLSLQSYASSASASDCVSDVSCNSDVSCKSEFSRKEATATTISVE